MLVEQNNTNVTKQKDEAKALSFFVSKQNITVTKYIKSYIIFGAIILKVFDIFCNKI